MALFDFGNLIGIGTGSAAGAAIGTAGTIMLILVLIWSLIWKGLALWKSARKNHLIWFIVLLIVNTIGILEILYIFVFSKISLKNNKRKTAQKPKTKPKKRRK